MQIPSLTQHFKAFATQRNTTQHTEGATNHINNNTQPKYSVAAILIDTQHKWTKNTLQNKQENKVFDN